MPLHLLTIWVEKEINRKVVIHPVYLQNNVNWTRKVRINVSRSRQKNWAHSINEEFKKLFMFQLSILKTQDFTDLTCFTITDLLFLELLILLVDTKWTQLTFGGQIFMNIFDFLSSTIPYSFNDPICEQHFYFYFAAKKIKSKKNMSSQENKKTTSQEADLTRRHSELSPQRNKTTN